MCTFFPIITYTEITEVNHQDYDSDETVTQENLDEETLPKGSTVNDNSNLPFIKYTTQLTC